MKKSKHNIKNRNTQVDEYVYHVNKNDKIIGKITKSQCLTNRMLHRGACVLVTNSKGEILVHQRAKTKMTFPGHYDLFFGGWVRYGETYKQTALRELKEETGIKGKPKIKFLFKQFCKDDDGDYFTQVYHIQYSSSYNEKFKFQKEEVEWAKFKNIKDAKLILKTKKLSNDTKELFQNVLKKFPRLLEQKNIEYISIVDKNDKVIGKGTYHEVHPKGKIFRAVRIFIKNSKNEYLLLKRSKTMLVYPDCWEIGVAGTVNYKESYLSTAKREIKAELNINPKKIKFTPIKKVWVDDKLENLFANIYYLVYDGKIKKQDDEISAVKYIPFNNINEFSRKNKMHVSCLKHFKLLKNSDKL